MISKLGIKNFKSIKQLSIPCKKLNVFIGEPNSGKSNIIEALALQSQNAISNQFLSKDIFRYNTIGDLFYDFKINQPIEIKTDIQTNLKYAIRENGNLENQFEYILDENHAKDPNKVAHDGKILSYGNNPDTHVRYYEFKRLQAFSLSYIPHLNVPHGENLPNLLLANDEFKKWVTDFLESKNLILSIKPSDNDITVSKFVEKTLYSYPYLSLSETLQRIIFHIIAIKSNRDCMLLFDEPESNTFPFYTKFLGERIALDETNQFFITTHNPYLLLSLIEKSSFDKLNVCLTEMNNYQTTVSVLSEEQISTVLDLNSDIFFNFSNIR